MKINFTKKEYSVLLEMIDIASWVISAHEIEENPEAEPYKILEQKIFSLAKDFDCGSKIGYIKNADEYFPTDDFELNSPHRDFIRKYDEENFWEVLIEKLCYQSIDKEVGLDTYDEMSGDDRISIYSKYENEWAEKLEKDGLNGILKT